MKAHQYLGVILCLAVVVSVVGCRGQQTIAAAREEISQGELEQSRAKYDKAKELFNAGTYDEAKPLLVELQMSGVDLGSRINRAIQRMLERIEKHEREAAEAKASREALAQYEEGVVAYEHGRLDEARRFFLAIRASGVSLGWTKDRRLRSYLAKIDKELSSQLAAGQRRAEEEARAAEEARLRQAREAQERARLAALKKYESAVSMYKVGKLVEARALFAELRASPVRLGQPQDRNVNEYIARIDKRLADEKEAARLAAEKERARAAEEERRRAEEAAREAQLAAAREMKEKEAQARAAALEKYDAAVSMYNAGRLVESKALFIELRDSGVSLGRSTDKSVADYITAIDRRVAEQEAARVAAEEARARALAAEVPPKPPEELPREDRETRKRREAQMEELAQKSRVRMEEDKFRAGQLAEEGQALLDRYEYESALEKFEEALELDPTLDTARKKVLYINEVLGKAPPSLEQKMAELQEIGRVREQQARFEVENAFAQAKKLYDGGRYEEAERGFMNVVDMIDLLEATIDMSALRRDADGLRAKARAALVEQRKREAAMRQTEAIRAAAEEELAQKQREERVVEELLSDAFRYYMEADYTRAEQACRAVLDRDSSNFYAKALLDKVKSGWEESRRKSSEKESDYAKAEHDTWAVEMEIPQSRVVTWPDAGIWDEVTKRRPYGNLYEAEGITPEAEKEIRDALDMPVDIQVWAQDFMITILDEIALQTGINIYVPDPLTDHDGTLVSEIEVPEFVMSNVPARIALEELLSVHGLGYRVAAPRLLVIEPRSYKLSSERLVWGLYDVNDLLVQTPTYVPEGVGAGLPGLAAEIKPLLTLQSIADLVVTVVRPESWSAAAAPEGAAGGLAAGPGMIQVRIKEGWLLIRQTPEIHEEIKQFLAMYRRGLARMRLVSLEAKLVELTDDDIRRLGFGYDFADIWNAATGESPLRVLSTEAMAGIGVRATYSHVATDFQVEAFLDFITERSAAKLTSVPRLTLVENQVSYVFRTDQAAYVANVVPVVSENQVAYQLTIATVAGGVNLGATATVSDDGKYVYLNVAPGFTSYVLEETSTPLFVEGILLDQKITLPLTSTTTMRTTAKVPDGGWLLLAGFSRTSRDKVRAAVPVLSHIPLVGTLFQRKSDVVRTTTVIILLRPHVLLYEEYEKAREAHGPTAPFMPTGKPGTF